MTLRSLLPRRRFTTSAVAAMITILTLSAGGCNMMNKDKSAAAANKPAGATFGDDVSFLRANEPDLVVLRDNAGQAQLVVSPKYQGRVMTSTTAGDGGPSFGFVNRDLIKSGKFVEHINPFGGEDRFWIGPEGG